MRTRAKRLLLGNIEELTRCYTRNWSSSMVMEKTMPIRVMRTVRWAVPVESAIALTPMNPKGANRHTLARRSPLLVKVRHEPRKALKACSLISAVVKLKGYIHP